jgi:hypothetical protein
MLRKHLLNMCGSFLQSTHLLPAPVLTVSCLHLSAGFLSEGKGCLGPSWSVSSFPIFLAVFNVALPFFSLAAWQAFSQSPSTLFSYLENQKELL